MWYFWILSKALKGVMPSLSHPISKKAYVELKRVEITNALGLIEPWIQMNLQHNQPVCACVLLCMDSKLENICGRRKGAKIILMLLLK